jgi:hypothetical protein
MKKPLALIIALLLALSFVSAIDFIPSGNVNLKNVYSLINGVYVNTTTLCIGGACQSSWPTAGSYSVWYLATGGSAASMTNGSTLNFSQGNGITISQTGGNISIASTLGISIQANEIDSDAVGVDELNLTDVTLNDFTNDAGFITGYTETDPKWVANESRVSTLESNATNQQSQISTLQSNASSQQSQIDAKVDTSSTSAWDKDSSNDITTSSSCGGNLSGTFPNCTLKNATVSWYNISGIPAGFADGVDDTGGTGGSGNVTGGGVANSLAKWTNSTNIGSSIAYDNGSAFCIGDCTAANGTITTNATGMFISAGSLLFNNSPVCTSATGCGAASGDGTGGWTNTSTLTTTTLEVNITAAGNAKLYLHDTANLKKWTVQTASSGGYLDFISPSSATVLRLDESSSSATLLNMIGTLSYSGASHILRNSTGSTIFRANNTNVTVFGSDVCTAANGLCAATGSSDGNSNVTAIGFSGTTTKTLQLNQTGGVTILNATFTDIDTNDTTALATEVSARQSIGNWSGNVSSYSTTAVADAKYLSLGNWSGNASNVWTKAGGIPDSNITSAATWNAKAGTGTSSVCAFGIANITLGTTGFTGTTCASAQSSDGNSNVTAFTYTEASRLLQLTQNGGATTIFNATLSGFLANASTGSNLQNLKVNGTDPNIYLNDTDDSADQWTIRLASSGDLFDIVSPSSAVILQLNKNTAGATIQNIIASASYNGAIPLLAKGASSQTANLLVVEDSGGSDYFFVNGSGAVNITTGPTFYPGSWYESSNTTERREHLPNGTVYRKVFTNGTVCEGIGAC